MNVIRTKEIESCIEGDIMREFLVDEEIDRNFIEHLANFGSLHYYPTFAKPYYRLDASEKFVLKGIQGNKSFRVILDSEKYERNLVQIQDIINRYNKTFRQNSSSKQKTHPE